MNLFTTEQIGKYTAWMRALLESGHLVGTKWSDSWVLSTYDKDDIYEENPKLTTYTSPELFEYWLSENYLK